MEAPEVPLSAAERVEQHNRERQAEYAAEQREQHRWEAVGLQVGTLWHFPDDVIRSRYRAALANVPESEWDDDPRIAASELVLSWRAGTIDRHAERAEAQRLLAEDQAAQIAAAEARRPPLSAGKPLFATVLTPYKNLQGRAWKRGDTIDLGASFWPIGKIAQLRDRGDLGAHPDHPTDIDAAVTLNRVPVLRSSATDSESESSEDRKRRLARERQARRRAKQKATAA